MTTTDDTTGLPVSQTVPPSPAVQALIAAAAAVAEQLPVELDGPQALADTAALLAVLDSLRISVMDHLGDVSGRQLHRLDGAGSASAWLARQGSSVHADDLPLARKLSRLPLLHRAVRDGQVGIKAAHQLAGMLTALRPHLDRYDGLIDGLDAEPVLTGVIVDGIGQMVCQGYGGLDDNDPRLDQLRAELTDIASRPQAELLRLEAGLLVLARHLDPTLLPDALSVLRDALLPSALEDRAAAAYENRGFTLTRNPDGSGFHVSEGECDLELGELLTAAIDAELAVDPDNPADTAAYAQLRQDGWQTGDDLPAPSGSTGSTDGQQGQEAARTARPRTGKQRRHDALKSALRKLLGSGALGLRDKVAPHIAVAVGIDTLHGQPGSVPAVSTATGTAIPLRLVQTWWCDSSITRFVMSLGRRVLETSHTERTLKAHERRAKHLETGGTCQAAGCRGPDTVPHHPDAWSRTGRTSYTDTVGLCDPDHHKIHTGHTLRLKDGRWIDEHGWTDGPSR